MATLVEQIRQMIDALAVVDPEAAAEFRGGSQNPLMNEAERPPAFPNVPRVLPLKRTSIMKNTAVQNPGKKMRASEIQAEDLQLDSLRINLAADSLVKGIIYSEILGKPVSRRSRHSRT